MVNKNKAENGFTLIETIAAVALAGLVLGVLAQVFLQCTYTQKQLEGRVTATILGASKLNELVNKAESAASGAFPKPYQQYQWTSQTESLPNGLEKVQLELKWSDSNGRSRSKILHQYRLAK